jgi:pimeloyl-ACP methyl ester carboxylesterase
VTSFIRNHVRIAYEVEGRGEPVILLHGFSQSRQAWREAGFVDVLLPAGRQVILVDLRGHGESDKPHDPDAYDLTEQTADVVLVLDALSLRQASFLGYSMGGAVAMGMALHFTGRCRGAVIGGAHPYPQDRAFYRDGLAAGLQGWLRIIEDHVGPLPESARAMIRGNDVEALRAAAHDRAGVSRELIASRTPLMFYAGTDDPVHELARAFAARADCGFLSLPGLNHMQAFAPPSRSFQRYSTSWTGTAKPETRAPGLPLSLPNKAIKGGVDESEKADHEP